MKTAQSLAWLERYAGKCGDKLPDSNRIHLPSCLTKGDVFKMMETELDGIGEKGCKESVFYRHWRTDLQHIAIPKVCPSCLPRIFVAFFSSFVNSHDELVCLYSISKLKVFFIGMLVNIHLSGKQICQV